MTPFRTTSGQTGRDAYIYELAQIENHERDIRSRRENLARIVEEELTGKDITVLWPIPSTMYPDATMPGEASSIGALIRLGDKDTMSLLQQLPS